MGTKGTGWLGAAAACALGVLGAAVAPQAHAQEQTVRGELTAVDARAGTFAVRAQGAPQPQRFRVDPATQIRENGRPAQLADLAVGEVVEVRAGAAPAGDPVRVALSVQVQPASGQPAPTSGGAPGAREESSARLGQRELPDTGTSLPLFALLGGLALVSGLTLRGLRQR